MRINSFTVGADPELFIINSKTNKVVSSVGLIPGVKGNPYTDDMPEGFGIETDNILAEFNIPPCYDKQQFIHCIEYMKDYLRNFVKRINSDYDIKCSAYEEVDSDQLQTPEANEFGCSADYNVYTLKTNPKPSPKGKNGRSAGFHCHFGYPSNDIQTSIALLQYFDAYLGLVSLLFDSDNQRRSLYGKAGAFRLCSYGFEYRTLSGAMFATETLSGLVYDQICRAVNAFNRGRSIPDRIAVQEAINNSDVKLAKMLISKYNLYPEACVDCLE